MKYREPITFRTTAQVNRWLKKEAKRFDLTRSSLIHDILKDWVNLRKEIQDSRRSLGLKLP